MATVVRPYASFNDGQVTLSFSFDDTSLLILSVTLVNNGPSGTLSFQAINPSNNQVIFSGSRAFGTGTITQDVSAFNQHMVNKAGHRGGVAPQLPFNLIVGWSST